MALPSIRDIIPNPALEISDFTFVKKDDNIPLLPKHLQAEAYVRLGMEKFFRTVYSEEKHIYAFKLIAEAAVLGHPFALAFCFGQYTMFTQDDARCRELIQGCLDRGYLYAELYVIVTHSFHDLRNVENRENMLTHLALKSVPLAYSELAGRIMLPAQVFGLTWLMLTCISRFLFDETFKCNAYLSTGKKKRRIVKSLFTNRRDEESRRAGLEWLFEQPQPIFDVIIIHVTGLEEAKSTVNSLLPFPIAEEVLPHLYPAYMATRKRIAASNELAKRQRTSE